MKLWNVAVPQYFQKVNATIGFLNDGNLLWANLWQEEIIKNKSN